MMRSLDNLDAGAVKACQSFQTLLKDDILGATLTVREAFAELNKNRCSNVFEQHRWASRTKFPPEALEFSAAMRLRALSVVPSCARCAKETLLRCAEGRPDRSR